MGWDDPYALFFAEDEEEEEKEACNTLAVKVLKQQSRS